MIFRHFIVLLIVVILSSGACDTTSPPPNGAPARSYNALSIRYPMYGIGFYNDMDAPLDGVRFEWLIGGQLYYCSAGFLNVKSEAQDSGGPDPIPPEGTIYWKTADGTEHQQHVAVTATVKNQRGFDGTIWLKISKDGVLVEPVTDAESWERAKQQKSMVP